MKIVKRILGILAVLAVLAAIVAAMIPEPTQVTLGEVTRGPFVVTADGEGRTRVKDRYVVSAPVAGHLPRLSVHPGDRVAQGAVLADIAPFEPPLLDARAKAQAVSQAAAARAAVAQSKARIDLAEAALARARTELGRTKALLASGAVAPAELEVAEFQERTAAAELESARFGARIARFELETAEAALVRFNGGPDKPKAARGGAGQDDAPRPGAVRAPVGGTVLRVFQESAAPVSPGAPLLEIGDPAAIEVVVDLLSADAVAVRPGAEAWIERWGGEGALEARVRLVEPSGFTKVSALGLEEQRVNVIVDFTGPPEQRGALGDGYRVYARIVVYRQERALQVPQSALFRRDDEWAVFVADAGRARVREVEIGRQSEGRAEVLGGLAEAERVVVHPSDKLTDGGKIEAAVP